MLGQVLFVFFYVGPPQEDIFFDPIYDLIYFGVNSIILYKLRYVFNVNLISERIESYAKSGRDF